MASLSTPDSPPAANPGRPRAFSALSNHSKKSRRSSISGPKHDLTETHDEKKRLNLNSKADPTKAINEAQPSAVALEESNLADLRTMTHKDAVGNIITDPDRANPTRPRMERPLETIRSFQRAAEYTDSTRRSPHAPAPGSKMEYYPAQDHRAESNRRSSYYGGSSNYGSQPRTRAPGGGHYGRNSSYSFRPDSFIEEGMGPNQYQQNRGMRNSTFGMNGQNGEHMSPAHSYPISYDTMTSGSEENAKTTNPSSVNSSLDHIPPYNKQDGSNVTSYGSNNSSITQNGNPHPFMQNGNGHPQYGSSHMRSGSAPMASVSAPAVNNPRIPIKLNSGTATQSELEAEAAKWQAPQKEKRKSWLKRRFSKKE